LAHFEQEGGLQVAKKRVGKFPKEFVQMAVEQLKQCDNIVALPKELGVHRRLLYTWRHQLDPAESGESPPENLRESTLGTFRVLAVRMAGTKSIAQGTLR